MRVLQIILFILLLLVGGFFFLQFWTSRDNELISTTASAFDSVPASSPVEEPDILVALALESEISATALISGSEKTDVPWVSRSPAAKRVCKIFPDPVWMTPKPVLAAGDVITLALFDNAVFEAKIRNVTVYPNGTVGMTAHLTGDQRGTIYLSYSEQKMRASVEIPGSAEYVIRYRPEMQSHYAVEVDRANSIILEGAESPLADSVVQKAEPTPPDLLSNPIAQADAPAGSTVIDVMIVYTSTAKIWAAANGGGIDTVINLVMQRANEAYTNSNTQITLRLVHSAEVDYAEGNIYDDLDELTFLAGNRHVGSSSKMDEVHDWRDEYGADFVCLLESIQDAGGLGWLMTSTGGDPGYAFCIARVEQSARTYTVVHEWGHNMGCSHSKTQKDSPWDAGCFRSYSAGWQWADTKPYYDDGYCSIMTYENFGYGVTYDRVAYFSNPAIDYTGNSTNPTGDAANGDNARTIREMKWVYEAYRDADLDLDDDGLPNDWEKLYFGGETSAIPAATAANGVNTVMETYIAGLDPTDPQSLFTASIAPETGFVVQWNAVSGRVYSVLGTSGLLDNFQPLKKNIFWPQSSWTDTVDRAERFYRVDVELND